MVPISAAPDASRMPVQMAPLDVQKLGKLPMFDGEKKHFAPWHFKASGYVSALGIFSQAELRVLEARREPLYLVQLSPADKRRAGLLWFLLLSMLVGPALWLMQRCEDDNGAEVWRQLVQRYKRLDGGAALGRLSQLLAFDFGNVENFQQHMSEWDVLLKEYEASTSPEELPDTVKKAVIIHGAPEPIKSHLELNAGSMDYASVREALVGYMRNREEWSSMPRSTVTEGAVLTTPATVASDAMDVSLVAAMKGKGKGKGKMKGKSKKGKTLGGVPVPPVFPGSCFKCGQLGHRSSECWAAEAAEASADAGWDAGPRCWMCGGWGHSADLCGNRYYGLQSVETVPMKASSIQCGVASASTDDWLPAYGPTSPSQGPVRQTMVKSPPGLDEKSHQTKTDDLDTYWQMGLLPSDETNAVEFQAQQIPVPDDDGDDLQEEVCEEELEALRKLHLR